MAIQCKSSTGVTLTHTTFNKQYIFVYFYALISTSTGEYQRRFAKSFYPQNNGVLTYEVSEVDLSNAIYRLWGTYTQGVQSDCGKKAYWFLSGISQSLLDIEIVVRGTRKQYAAYYDPNNLDNRNPRWVNLAHSNPSSINPITGQPFEEGEEPEESGVYYSNTIIHQVNECVGNSIYGGHGATNLSGGTPVRYEHNNGSFTVSVYEDGELLGTALTNGKYPEPDTLPDDAIVGDTVSNTNPVWVTKTFEKEANTEAIEVLRRTPTSRYFDVWKITLDDNGNEINRRTIYSFGNSDTEPLVEWSLDCIEIDECPPDTCTVDCNSHYCCYGSDGISIHSFEK